jgi:DNA helicase-2/ATP-dependent DNA helicase PcrA
MDLTSHLNKAQIEAVMHTEGPLLVLAGAGSGKTRVLTYRVAYLLKEKRVSPYNILAITFTNKAAQEMKERVAEMVPEAIADLWICTFHAACVRILRRQACFLGYRENFVIYDEQDSRTLIKNCLKELDLDEKIYPPPAVQAVISRAKNDLLDHEDFEAQARGTFYQKVAAVYKLYQEKIRQNNSLDFDDLLFQTVLLFKENEPVLNYYQNKFRYILVDEYQDTNNAQYVLVKLLAQNHRNIFAVGDPDQSIYCWRGANIKNILDFEKDYPEARLIKLEQNYRSTQSILEAANYLIVHNYGRKEKRLWSAAEKGVPVILHAALNEHQEAKFLAGQIFDLRAALGLNFRDFAVLYRTHAMSRVVEEIMLSYAIPYTIVGGLKFYARKEIKDILAYLRLLVNPSDMVSLARVINVPKRGIGEASLSKLLTFAREKNLSGLAALGRAKEIPGLTGKVRQACEKLATLFQELNEQKKSLSLTGLTREILTHTGYQAELEAENTVEAQTRLENLAEFLSVTHEFDLKAQNPTLTDFLAEVSLFSDLDQMEEKADQVVLMSLHGAKGLEFPVIFLIGMEEGIFPHARSLDERIELEEERRLCYVGITRAKKLVYLTFCRQRTLYGNTRWNKPSRFLEEIPPELLINSKAITLTRKRMSS